MLHPEYYLPFIYLQQQIFFLTSFLPSSIRTKTKFRISVQNREVSEGHPVQTSMRET